MDRPATVGGNGRGQRGGRESPAGGREGGGRLIGGAIGGGGHGVVDTDAERAADRQPERPAEEETGPLVDALEAVLGVRDRFDRRPPGRGRQRDGRCDRNPYVVVA